MRALVTGSAGFVGRHMVQELYERGYETFSYDIASFNPRDAMGIFHNGWLDDYGRFDLVVHCAYHIGGRAAIDGVNTNFAKNVTLDGAMFDWAVRTKQKRVLYFSSSAAYPVYYQDEHAASIKTRLHEGMINDAEDLIGLPDSNYGWAKVTGERLAADARKNGLEVTVVRPFSGYGEDQSLDYPFPSIVRRAAKGDLTVWGPEGQARDWIHISDVVSGALAVVESGTKEPVNLCTGRAVEIGELARMVYDQERYRKDLVPDYSLLPTYDETKPTGVFYRVGDPTRMLQYYTPKVTLEEGIQRALRRINT